MRVILEVDSLKKGQTFVKDIEGKLVVFFVKDILSKETGEVRNIVEKKDSTLEEISLIMSQDEAIINEPDLYSPDYGKDRI